MNQFKIPIQTDVLVLTKEEVLALFNEFSNSWISRDNYICHKIFHKMEVFLRKADEDARKS